MSFLNPAMLAFGAAIAVPILIHLLNRRQFRTVEWAAMRFILASIEKNRRRMQVEDLILLLLRCLIVGLFALALARPALRSATAFLGAGRVTAAVVVDHSASLAASDGAGTRFDLARQAAEQAVDGLPQGSSVALIFSGDRASMPIPEPSFDLNLIRKTLREAAVTDLPTDHAAGITAALEALETQTALRKEILLVTDRQALGWRRMAEIAGWMRERGRDVRLRILRVGESPEDNLAVVSLTRSPGFVPVGSPIRFDAEVANRGRTEVRQVRATLHVEGGQAVDETVMETLAPGETRRLSFFGRLSKDGFQSITVRLPADRFPSDDSRTMVVRATKRVRVLVVDGDPTSNSGFFLRHALQPVPADEGPEFYLQPQMAVVGQLGLARLSDYDAVILADVPSLPATAVDNVVRYVREGGALLVFPGPQAVAAFYNGELVDRTGLLPAKLGALREAPANGDAPTRLALQGSDYQHPVFALWNEPGAGSLGDVRFRAALELIPNPAKTGSASAGEAAIPEVMLRFADGTPAAVDGGVGLGRVMLFSSTAGTGWNDLAVRPAFIPMLHRAIGSFADAAESRYNVRAGGSVRLRQPAEYAGRDVTVTPPGGGDRRWTRTLRATPGASLLEWDETSAAGVYRAALGGSPEPLAVFAVQPDPMESDLADLSADRLADLERFAQVIEWGEGIDLKAALERERVGIELWLPLALAVMLFAVVEVWLAQAFSRPK